MEACAFTYDGGLNLSVTITSAVIGVTYRIRCSDTDSSIISAAAVSGTLVLNVIDIGGDPAGYRFRARVDRLDNSSFVGASGFAEGYPGEAGAQQSWTTDGADPPTVSLTFPSVNGKNYFLGINSNGVFITDTLFVGDGTLQTVQVTSGTGTTFGYLGTLGDADTGEDLINRMFVAAVADDGYPGNPVIAADAAGVIVTLDSVDVTSCCLAGSWTRRLNRPSTAQIRVPMDCASAAVGSPLKIEALIFGSYEIVHHGPVLLVETDTGEDTGYTVYNSTDPMELWQWRPFRADDGDFTKPAGSGATDGSDIFATYLTGSLMMEAVLKNTEGNSTAQGNPSLTPPSDAEGPTFLTFGAFATGGTDLSGAPTDFPMTIAELASLLISTGEVDLVITPTDPGGGIMGTIDGYNGRYGTDLSATIVFSYGMNAHNVRRLRWNEDMTSVVNKLWYYGGPRLHTAADPAGDQHWCYNVQGDDPSFNPDGISQGAWASATSYSPVDTVTNLSPTVTFICTVAHTSSALDEPGVGVNWRNFWEISMVPPGGRSSPPAGATDNQLGVSRISSQGNYGVRMDIQIFDALDNCGGVGDIGHDFMKKRWQQESWLRAIPREIIHVTPTRGTEIGTFNVGDLVGVEATAAVRGGFSGAQRVYEYTVSWDNDGVLELSELQTSADNEGL